MLCPYNRKTLKFIKATKFDLINEEAGISKGSNETYIEEYTLMPCVQSDCGVWHNGKCYYNQGNNG